MAPATVAQGPIGSSSLFTFLGSLQVTPDAVFHVGSFARFHYGSATDRFLVTFGTVEDQIAGGR